MKLVEILLKRKLDKTERIYRENPRGMAHYHYREEGTSYNPYVLGTQESLEYTDAFQQLRFREHISH